MQFQSLNVHSVWMQTIQINVSCGWAFSPLEVHQEKNLNESTISVYGKIKGLLDVKEKELSLVI